MCEVFEVTIHIGDTNEVSRFIVSPDLEKVFLPLFTSEMLGIALDSNHMLQIHKMKALWAKFKVAFVSLVQN